MAKLDENEFAEHLSVFVDDERNQANPHELIDDMECNAACRGAWQRYHLVRDVLQRDYHPALPANFAQMVCSRLEAEPDALPTNALPTNAVALSASARDRSSAAASPGAWRQVWAPVAGFGMAAGLGAAVYVGAQLMQGTPAQLPLVAEAPASLSPSVDVLDAASTTLADNGTRWNLSENGERNKQIERRLNSLLTNHLEDSAMGRVQGIMSHARVVSYDDAAISVNDNESF